MTLETFEERLEYLKTNSVIGEETFGHLRYLSQRIYNSSYWKNNVRNKVIARDYGRDLAIKDMEIRGRIVLHHINPITIDNVRNNDSCIFDIENLICVSEDTHRCIHYGRDKMPTNTVTLREPNDTCPWKR